MSTVTFIPTIDDFYRAQCSLWGFDEVNSWFDAGWAILQTSPYEFTWVLTVTQKNGKMPALTG